MPPKDTSVEIQPDKTRIGSETHTEVYMWDVLNALIEQIKLKKNKIHTPQNGKKENGVADGHKTDVVSRIPKFGSLRTTQGFPPPEKDVVKDQ